MASVKKSAKRAPSHRTKARRGFASLADLQAAVVAEAKARLRAHRPPEWGTEAFFARWRRDYGPSDAPAPKAHAHFRVIRVAFEDALSYLDSRGLMPDALEGPDRQLYSFLMSIDARALTWRRIEQGGLNLGLPLRSRSLIVDLALRQFKDFTASEVALLSLVAGFMPATARRTMTPAEVIALEAKIIRAEIDSQARKSPMMRLQRAQQMKRGRAGRPKKES